MMKRILMIVPGLVLALAGAAHAVEPAAPLAPGAEAYRYGQALDVAKVISITDVSDQEGVVPATLVYQDSKGVTHRVQYLTRGGYDQTRNAN